MVEPQKILAGEASCRDIVKCIYRLSDFELIIYRKLAKGGPLRADDLAPVVRKDRSTVYRALQKLVSSGLAFRETKSIERGGYYYAYSAVSPEHLKQRLHKCADDWFENMNSAIEDFDLV
ncbi:MAG TPA: helix-turn-helix domain-containing protein [Thermoplasmata archaeon]